MKKVMLLATVIFCFINVFAQNENTKSYLKNNIFYTIIESGAGENIPVSFKISSDDILKIKNSKIYISWEKETFSNPENEGYIAEHKSMSHFDMFIMGEIQIAAFKAILKLKNGTSFLPVKGNGGLIYINDVGEINFSFPFKAQNGYGNMIYFKVYYSIFWDETKNEIESECFIS